MIRHYKHILLIGIHGFDALVHREMLFFSQFSLESKFIDQMGQTWTLIIISILFVIGHYKHIFLIGIHGFDAFDWHKKLFFPPFSLESMFIPQMRQT